jgi:hypothetical protein
MSAMACLVQLVVSAAMMRTGADVDFFVRMR